MNFFPSFLVALALSFALTPAMGKIAVSVGLLDHPSDRKFHLSSMPLLGGAAVAASFFVVCLLNPRVMSAPWFDSVAIVSIAMLALGLVDDFRPVPEKIKLFLQFVCAWQLVAGGVHYNLTGLKLLDGAITSIIFVSVVNGVNIIDIEDGFAGGVAAIAAFFICVASFMIGDARLALYCAILCGALLGFLFFNYYPASIFGGNAGSMFAGALLASAAIVFPDNKRFVNYLVPLIVMWIIPFDVGMIFISRLAARRRLFVSARDHITHRMKNLGAGIHTSIGGVYTVSIFAGLGGILMLGMTGREASITLMSLIFMTLTGWFVLKDLVEYN